jgi:hypothetical protein
MLTVLDVRQQEPVGPATEPLRLRADVNAVLAALCHSSLGQDYSVQDYIPHAGLSVMAVLKVGHCTRCVEAFLVDVVLCFLLTSRELCSERAMQSSQHAYRPVPLKQWQSRLC